MSAGVADCDCLRYLDTWLRQRAGLQLSGYPADFIDARLAGVARRFGFVSSAELISQLPQAAEALAEAVTEAFIVPDTAFFRDDEVFHTLRDQVLPGLIAKRARSRVLRVWSAACASGQELYSIAMLLADFGLPDAGWKILLTGSDLSAAAIEQADAGIYSAAEMGRGLMARHVESYFDLTDDGWQVCRRIRDMVTFRRFNLCEDVAWIGTLDIVLCRHVLMYFDEVHRAAVTARIASTLCADGVLVTGSTERVPPATGFYHQNCHAPGIYTRWF